MTQTTLADDLDRLEILKRKSERVGRYKTDRAEAFKTWEVECLERMERERSKSHRSEDGTLFTRCDDRVKGQVEDRRLYVRWSLEQDEGIQEFLEYLVTVIDGPDATSQAWDKFYDAIMNTEAVTYQAKQDKANALARSHIDDEAPLPPGLTFRPDPYIQQRRS